jgi:hypothetical protein
LHRVNLTKRLLTLPLLMLDSLLDVCEYKVCGISPGYTILAYLCLC